MIRVCTCAFVRSLPTCLSELDTNAPRCVCVCVMVKRSLLTLTTTTTTTTGGLYACVVDLVSGLRGRV